MDITAEDLEIYRQVLDQEVCSFCRKTGYGNYCQVGALGVCPLKTHLKSIVEAVLSTPKSEEAADYLPNLRRLVCSECENQDEEGSCCLREQAACGVDSYMVLVIQAIENAHDRLELARSRGVEKVQGPCSSFAAGCPPVPPC